MKTAVMGAGAVGCYYGGMLARAGHAVTLIGRSSHVDAMRQNGLYLEAQTFQEHIAVDATTDAEGARGAELVLFCVKSADTESAGKALLPYLAPGAVVLSLQNGVDNAERLRTVLPHTVLPAVVYVATEMAGPGHVKHHGRGELVIGDAPASAAIAAVLEAAKVPTRVSDNVMGALWAKLLVNCAYNAMSAITRLPYGELVRGVGVHDSMRAVMEECLAVARADGITVPGDSWVAIEQIAKSMPGQYSSTAQDLMRGKPTEIDYLNGYVARRGEIHGIATPVNRLLHTLVKLIEK